MSEQLSPLNKTFKQILGILVEEELTPVQDLAILTRLIIFIFDLAEKQGLPKVKIMRMRKLIAEMIVNSAEQDGGRVA
jgi:hypothetical protein